MPWPMFMNVPRFKALMVESDFEVIVATSLKNVNYTSGALIETQRRIPLRLALVVLPNEGDPTFIVCNIEEDLAQRESSIEDLRTYVEFRESPIEVLADTLHEKGLDKSRIGIEKEHLMAIYLEELARVLPHAQLVAADRLLDEVRMVKTSAEIQILQRAALVTEQAIDEAFTASLVGDREKDVALRIHNNVIQLGADSIRFCVLGAGENSFPAHHIPGEKRLESGELVRLDYGAYFGAYASDVARMAVVERGSPHLIDTYKRYRDIQRSVIEQMQPGTQAATVYDWCKAAFEKAGLTFSAPHIGHGTGVDGGHEDPILQPFNQRTLEPNMIFYVEPILRDPQVGAYHLEDLVLITESGPQILTTYSDTSEIFVIGGRE